MFSLLDMDSDGSEFYYADEMTNENQKNISIGAIGNEENQQTVDVFTMRNMQNYILAQRVQNTVKKKQSTT